MNLALVICFVANLILLIWGIYLLNRIFYIVSYNPPLVDNINVQAEGFEIVRLEGKGFVRIGSRTAGHPDIKEALDTPGLAVRKLDGTVDLGKQ